MNIGNDPQQILNIQYVAGISIIVPTFQEVENIPGLLARVDAVRRKHNLTLEVIFVDDNSRDGSVEAVAAAGFEWARMVVRSEDRGLSSAVIHGFSLAQYPVLVCMDCDLSHPPEKIPDLVLGLGTNQQMMIGSRYVPGGSTDDEWGFLRWLNSQIAIALARPLTKIKDPMSGFFALRKSDFEAAQDLNPVGYKIALELIVKSGLDNIGEVPIHFTDRVLGESKLTLKEQLLYLRHVRRLYIHRFSNAMHVAQFLVVGASGVVVNLGILTLLNWLGMAEAISLAGGLIVSVITNFLLNRRFTFSYARDRPIGGQFLAFVGASAIGMVVNYSAALYANTTLVGDGPFSLQLAAMIGIASGMVFNYVGSRFFVFRKKYVRK